ncbi:MAG: hypothetical protein V3W34_10030 [Phycisphaerae bacterium]
MDWLSLFLLALLLAVAYMQVLQGVISALIMCVLTLLCTVICFATYEYVALSFLVGPLGDLSIPVAFVATFAVPLIVLRVAMDALISRATLIPVLIDRACAAPLSLVTAYVTTGMLAVAIQMLPFGGSFLGHAGIDQETGDENTLWLNPDRFAVGVASMMSNGLFSGKSRLSDEHPDLVQEIIWAQASPHELRHVVPPGSIRVVKVEQRDYIFDKTVGKGRRGRRSGTPASYDPQPPPDGKQWYLVRLALKREAHDEDQRHRFCRRQIRLVGSERPGGKLVNFAPVAINDNDTPRRAVRITDDKVYTPSDGSEVDFVFELPVDAEPGFIEYMIGARADLGGHRPESDISPTEPAALGNQGRDATVSGGRDSSSSGRSGRSGRGDRVSGVRSTLSSHFGDSLPMVMSSFQDFDLEMNRGALVGGHVYGNVADQGGGSRSLSRFEVPSDKRLFHLEVEQLRARSMYGKALNVTVTTVQNYRLRDDAGRSYTVVGQYVVAPVSGREVIEIQYFPDAVAAAGRGGIRAWARIKRRDLQAAGNRLVYLFLVEPGAYITEFTTGRRPTDLRDLNLVAPN